MPVYLKIERLKKEMTQEELAATLGISRSYIAALETKKEVPGVYVKGILETYFNMPIEKLLETIKI